MDFLKYEKESNSCWSYSIMKKEPTFANKKVTEKSLKVGIIRLVIKSERATIMEIRRELSRIPTT